MLEKHHVNVIALDDSKWNENGEKMIVTKWCGQEKKRDRGTVGDGIPLCVSPLTVIVVALCLQLTSDQNKPT